MNVVVPDRLRESQYGYPNLVFRLGWALHLLSFFAIGTNFDLYFLSIGTCFDLYFRFCTVECRFFLFNFVFHLIDKVLGFFLQFFRWRSWRSSWRWCFDPAEVNRINLGELGLSGRWSVDRRNHSFAFLSSYICFFVVAGEVRRILVAMVYADVVGDLAAVVVEPQEVSRQ